MKITLRRWMPTVLMVFAASMCGDSQTAASADRPVFNVLDYGAKNDASVPATEAFARAIAAAKAAGGGTVFVPAGHYVSGPIEMVSNLTLDFDAGAVVQFPATILPFTPDRQQGIETLTPVPLIGGHDLENVAVVGRGVLMSSNADWMKLHGREQPSGGDPGSADGPHWEQLLNDLNGGKTIPEEEYKEAAAELRPSFVRFMNCKNGGFNRSTQHLLAVYLQESGNPMSFWDVDSSVAIFGRAALERWGTGRFLLGSIVSAVD
jgi:polygalacturonase